MTQNIYCERIYKSLYIEKNNNGEIGISPCCVSPVQNVDVVNFYEDKNLNYYRSTNQDNIKIKECKYCWNSENLGINSYRIQTNNANYQDPYEVKLNFLDYNVTPVCNAKCIVCSSHYSSSWAAEDKKFNRVHEIRSVNNILKSNYPLNLDLTNLSRIYFNGGEPFLSDDIEIVLTEIEKQQNGLHNLKVEISTNGSIFPSEKQIELIKKSKKCELRISIDAIEEQFEYIRYPLVWKEVRENILKMASISPKIRIKICPNVGIHNILEVKKLEDWTKELQNSVSNSVELNFHSTQGPLSLANASSNLKLEIKNNMLTDNTTVIQMLENSPSQLDNQRWVLWLSTIDWRRSLNWKHTFKLLASLHEKVKIDVNK
jgi:organic radical activating enzyme